MRNRIFWIDCAKFISIFGIVFAHLIEQNVVYNYICSFNISIFFLLSGYTFSVKNIDSFTKVFVNKVKRIMMPYFTFAIGSYFIYLLIGSFVARDLIGDKARTLSNGRLLFGVFYGNSRDMLMKFNEPLWFLPCLFCVSIITYFIIKKRDDNKYLLLMIVVLMLLTFIYDKFLNSIIFPWGLDSAIPMTIFFILGYLFKKNYTNIMGNLNKTMIFMLSIISMIAGIILFNYNISVSVAHCRYGNLFIFFFSGIVSCFGYLLMAHLIPKNKIIEKLGQSTLIILVIHKFLVIVCKIKLEFVKEWIEVHNYFGIALTAFIIILICVLIGEIILKIFPPFLGQDLKKVRRIEE